MRLWWVSISLFMEWEGEQGVVIFCCCSSNGIPHWLMRLERHGGLVGQVHLHLHPVVVDGGGVLNVKVV